MQQIIVTLPLHVKIFSLVRSWGSCRLLSINSNWYLIGLCSTSLWNNRFLKLEKLCIQDLLKSGLIRVQLPLMTDEPTALRVLTFCKPHPLHLFNQYNHTHTFPLLVFPTVKTENRFFLSYPINLVLIYLALCSNPAKQIIVNRIQ